jgi:hypothetical protein
MCKYGDCYPKVIEENKTKYEINHSEELVPDRYSTKASPECELHV